MYGLGCENDDLVLCGVILDPVWWVCEVRCVYGLGCENDDLVLCGVILDPEAWPLRLNSTGCASAFIGSRKERARARESERERERGRSELG